MNALSCPVVLVLVVLLSGGGFACSHSDGAPSTGEQSSPTEPQPSTPSAAEPETPTATPTKQPASSAAGLTVTKISGTDQAPATGTPQTPVVAAHARDDGVLVNISQFNFFCAPPPEFSASLEGTTLAIVARPPQGPPSRCFGPHDAVLLVAGVPPGSYTVSVTTPHGDEPGTAQVDVPAR